mgnify:CR=1 FL=1
MSAAIALPTTIPDTAVACNILKNMKVLVCSETRHPIVAIIKTVKQTFKMVLRPNLSDKGPRIICKSDEKTKYADIENCITEKSLLK